MSFAGCLLSASLACSMAGLAANQGQPVIRLNVNLTVVHATVLDRSGQFVPGLEKQDFKLFVDGAERPITAFEPDDAPVAAGILVDNSASMSRKGPEVIAAALAFARASNPEDEMFVVHFSDQVQLGLPPEKPFTGSISELETALSRFSAEGTTALYDAVALAASQFRKTTLERKILLIISDGGDNSSQKQFPDVLKATQLAGILVYCIGLYDEADRDRNPRVLSQLAELSGGRAFFPSELKDVTSTCVKIAKDIRRQYTLGFEGQEDGAYHRIKIVAEKRQYGELKVQSRSGYFAPIP